MSLRDEWCCLQHGQCKHFNGNSDRSESTCKRLDHKHFKFAKPWFKLYDCGQFQSHICRNFEPAEWCKYLHEHWTGYDDYYGDDKPKGTISLVIDNDFSVRYSVTMDDFVNNTFIDENGNLKWVEKTYYKVSRKSPIGYELVYERNANE